MAWVAIDDGFSEHPKILALKETRAGRDALIAFIDSMCWANRGKRGTPRRDTGDIPNAVLKTIGATRKTAEILTEIGLWECYGDGFRIHDWSDYQHVDHTAAARKAKQRAKQDPSNHAGYREMSRVTSRIET